MDSAFSPEDHLARITQRWIGSSLLMGAILFPVLEFMDYFVSPEHFKRFIVYRLCIAVVLLLFYYLNRLRTNRTYQYAISVFAVAASAVTIELAILQSGGQSSIYYAAMMILIICALGFVPVSMTLAFTLVGIIYGIYAVPILLSGPVTSGVFVSNNAFLISTAVIGLLLRYHNQKLIMSELRLRAELSEDKRKLQGAVTTKAGELAMSEERYSVLFENATEGIALLDRNGVITDVNPRFCEIHHIDRQMAIGMSHRMFDACRGNGDPAARLGRIFTGETVVYETDHYRKDGSTISLEISAKKINLGGVEHIQLFHRDTTETKRLQDQLLQSQKMESLGALAGGIAHDFNNVLTAILSHAEVLRRRVGGDDVVQKSIKVIVDAGGRSGRMVSKLLSFARREKLQMTPTDLNSVIAETVALVERTLVDRNVQVKVLESPEIPLIMGDSIHIEQVLTNLIMNAMDAMPKGGRITVSTARKTVSSDAAARHTMLPAGDYVLLQVADTGSGIPREILDRIFDPFFTTKSSGKGTGLGLAMVYGIVKSHGGEILVSSEPGKGAAFDLFFPVLQHRPISIPAHGSSMRL